VFELLREKLPGQHVLDLRHEPLEVRKATLTSVLRGCPAGMCLNEHPAHDA
jgi:hypothetical protein